MAVWSNITKNVSTFVNSFRHGKELTLGDIQDKTFNDSIFNGEAAIKDLTFSNLQPQSWSLPTKSTSTFTNETRN